MKLQDFDKLREGIRLGCDRMSSFTAENAEVNQDMIDQLIVNEIISEIVEATNKIFNDHLEKHGISTTSIQSDEIMADVRKWLYDDLKPSVEPKMKEETIMENFNIQLDLAPEFLMKKFDIGTPVRHPSLTASHIYQYDGRHTTVEWCDGTKTTVCCEDPEKYTEWGGFCACVAKKLYGSTTNVEDMLENAKGRTAWPAKRKQIEREKIKKMCRERHDRAVMEREEKIAAKMEEMWIANEATKRLYADDSKVEVKEGSENA